MMKGDVHSQYSKIKNRLVGTVLDILTSSYIAIMIDFDLKHKVINPRGKCQNVKHRPPDV